MTSGTSGALRYFVSLLGVSPLASGAPGSAFCANTVEPNEPARIPINKVTLFLIGPNSFCKAPKPEFGVTLGFAPIKQTSQRIIGGNHSVCCLLGIERFVAS